MSKLSKTKFTPAFFKCETASSRFSTSNPTVGPLCPDGSQVLEMAKATLPTSVLDPVLAGHAFHLVVELSRRQAKKLFVKVSGAINV